MYFTKIQGPRPARQGSWGSDFQHFHLFPPRHSSALPAHIQPSPPIDRNDLQRLISYFRSHHLPSSWMRSDFTWCHPKAAVDQQKKEQKTRLESVWFPFLIQVWNEIIDFSDFFIMFSCRDSVSGSTLLPPIHPFYSCITHDLNSLNITLYSHLMMDMHDIKKTRKQQQIYPLLTWNIKFSKRAKLPICDPLTRSRFLDGGRWYFELASLFQKETGMLAIILKLWNIKKRKSEWGPLYRINGCAHKRTTDPI